MEIGNIYYKYKYVKNIKSYNKIKSYAARLPLYFNSPLQEPNNYFFWPNCSVTARWPRNSVSVHKPGFPHVVFLLLICYHEFK